MQRLRQLTFASLQCDRKKRKTRREIFLERMDRPDPLGALGGPHCASVSEGRPQGATAASAVGDAARALRSAVLQPERPDDGGPACEAESVRRFAGAVLEKVPDETTVPTSATGWSATDWRTSCSGDQGSPGRAGGGGGGGGGGC